MEDNIQISLRGLLEVFKTEFWKGVIITILITGLGIGYAFYSQEEFVSEGKILPEIQGKVSGGLGQFAGLASLAGVDLNSMAGGNVDAVRPDLYPDVIASTEFYLKLFKIKVKDKENKEVIFEKYYHEVIEKEKDFSQELLSVYPVDSKDIIVINRVNEIRLKNLKERISASIDKKSGIITISTKMPDPVIAAEISNFAMQYLMEYVKLYRTEKLKKDVEYLANQVANSRGKFYSTQEKKARYTDNFQDMALQSADVQRERIESEYRLSSSFYNELLKKYEEAKFKLHQETPVFKILEPPVAPVKKFEPKRAIITLSFFVFGIFVSALVVLSRSKNRERIFFSNNF